MTNSARIALRHVLRPREVVEQSSLQVLSVYRDHGVVPKDSRDDNFNKTPLDRSRYQEVRPGDLVINKMKAWQGSLAVSQHHGIVSPDYLVCAVTSLMHPPYLHYLLRSAPLIFEYERRSKGIRPAQWRLYWEDLADISVAVPPMEEQRRIAYFLDVETARIGQLASLRRRQVALLESREQAILHKLMSGQESPFIQVKRLVTRITSGPRGWGELASDEGTPFLRIANMPRRGITLDLSDLVRVTASPGPERERTRTRPGDILVSITADIGSVAVVDDRAGDGNVSQHIALLRPNSKRCDSRWLAHAIKSPAARQQLTMASYGGTKVGLGLEDIAELRIPVSDLPTQRAHARRIDENLEQIERSRTTILTQLKLFVERRQALITAAVTGQMDVTTARWVST